MINFTIQDAVIKIISLIENAIIEGGIEAKNNLIRTQQPVNLLHDAAKASFIAQGVNPNLISPLFGEHAGEQKLAGYFKCKDQDICLSPNDVKKKPEILNFDGILKGKKDSFGEVFTEHTLSVNVRSQLSSIAKNFDTLYERTFAEALNLHLRCEKMVLGEFYMIPVFSYDDKAAKNHEVKFKPNKRVMHHIQKYIYSFNAINNRNVQVGEEYKYERVCLLIVDFSKQTPIIYNTDEQLKQAGLLPNDSTATINQMNFPTFTKTLLDIYESRFGSGRFI